MGRGGYWRTCATRDDEPSPVWTSLPITLVNWSVFVCLCCCLLLQYQGSALVFPVSSRLGIEPKIPGWLVQCVCVLLLQDLLQSCSRGGRRRVEDMCYERRRAEACVDESAHHALVNAGMILLLLFLQKQSLAFAVYLFGIGTLHTGPGLKKKAYVIMLSP